jgi:hypothetical protein
MLPQQAQSTQVQEIDKKERKGARKLTRRKAKATLVAVDVHL